MALLYRRTHCPTCGSANIRESARVEANEFGPGQPVGDAAVYDCRECGAEFDSMEPEAGGLLP